MTIFSIICFYAVFLNRQQVINPVFCPSKNERKSNEYEQGQHIQQVQD